MVNRTFETMQACLLCDFDEILRRAGIGSGKPGKLTADLYNDNLLQNVSEAIRYHRTAPMEEGLETNSLAYIVHAAHSIALGSENTSDSVSYSACDTRPLESVFNHLNRETGHKCFQVDWTENNIQYPSDESQSNADAYRRVLEQWEKALDPRLFEPSYSNALLETMRRFLSYVPAACQNSGRQDVSLVHQAKAVAAIGCCIERWLEHRGITDYRDALISDKAGFMDAEPFALFSLDLSGIQSFIYTISSKGALKGLKVRSFYLSMLMEHVVDTILEACRLFRVNLIYSGGGRAHLLLPNDGECIGLALEKMREANVFLREHYGASLFLASGYATASVNQLASLGNIAHGFSDLFRAASQSISQRKLQRYSPTELLELNHKDDHHSSDRECVICGRSGQLVPHGENDMVCKTCDRLERFSNTLTENDLLLKVERVESANAIPLPGGMWLSRTNSPVQSETIVRCYCINSNAAPIANCVWLNIGNYRASNIDGSAMTFEQLAEASSGIKRLGVLRADVDNLGMLFAQGLVAPEDANPHRFETLPRYMALSSAMTAFFQKEINRIIEKGSSTWIPDGSVPDQRNVSIVYSGGDDVFLVGAWNEVLDAGLALQDAFREYSGGSVTLSAGFGVFTPHEPVGVMAEITADLEENAKQIEDGGKNAVALFSPVTTQNGVSFVFHWDTLRESIIEEKLPLLARTFKDIFTEQQDAGNAFLYQVLALLRDIKRDPIAIARLAYLLARHAPEKKHNPNESERLKAAHYDEFSRHVYKWALEPNENRALQAAILLHVYSNRKEIGSDV